MEKRALYDRGMSDAEVATRVGLDPSSVTRWRQRNGLDPNKMSSVAEREARSDERLELYREGLTDRQIAERQGVARSSITGWRLRRDLEPNTSVPKHLVKRRELWDEGLTDTEIAQRQGVTKATVWSWRDREGLDANYDPEHHSHPDMLAQMEERRELWEAGLSDEEMARRQNVTAEAIFAWRKREGLPPNQPRAEERWSRTQRPWPLSDTDAAYLAGIIDGEGTVTITRDWARDAFYPSIDVSSVDVELRDWIEDRLGRKAIPQETHYGGLGKKTIYKWTIRGLVSVHRLGLSIQSYMTIKARRLQVAMEYCRHRLSVLQKHSRVSDGSNYGGTEYRLYWTIRCLNGRMTDDDESKMRAELGLFGEPIPSSREDTHA